MSTPTEKIRAQKLAFDYALSDPDLPWGRHLIGPNELEWLFDQARCAERVNDANKWRKVAMHLSFALSNEAVQRQNYANIRASALAKFHKLKDAEVGIEKDDDVTAASAVIGDSKR